MRYQEPFLSLSFSFLLCWLHTQANHSPSSRSNLESLFFMATNVLELNFISLSWIVSVPELSIYTRGSFML